MAAALSIVARWDLFPFALLLRETRPWQGESEGFLKRTRSRAQCRCFAIIRPPAPPPATATTKPAHHFLAILESKKGA